MAKKCYQTGPPSINNAKMSLAVGQNRLKARLFFLRRREDIEEVLWNRYHQDLLTLDKEEEREGIDAIGS